MIQGRDRTCLALESFVETLGGDFDRNVTIEARIPRAVYLAHPARADRRQDLVRAEPISRDQRHMVQTILAHSCIRYPVNG